MNPGWNRIRVLIAVGFFLSGMAGLVDQVVWSRYLGLFVGSSTAALTIVLATFMGGLAIGNHVFGRLVDAMPTDRRALRLYAILEAWIGLWCVFFPEILGLATRAYITIAAPLGFGATGTGPLKLALAAATILPPTILMGGTLPVLARIVTTRVADVAASVGRLYFVNSFGAAFGAALAGFLLIPALGLDPTIRSSGAVNLLLAVVFALALRGRSTFERPPAPGADVGGDRFSSRQRLVVMAVIGAAGAVSMIYEVVWTRLLSLVMGGSTYSFTIMVTTFITGITLGSLATSRLFGPRGGGGDPLRWLAIAETGVFASILPVVPLYDRLPYYFAAVAAFLEREPETFPLYLSVKVFTAFALMILPTFFIGMTLPLASRVAVDRLAVVGRKVGSVFSINTLGTVLGAALTGLWLVPAIGLRGTLLLGIGCTAALAVALWWVAPNTTRRVRLGLTAGAITLMVGITALGPWNLLVLHFGMYRHKTFAITSWDELIEDLERFELLYAQDGKDTSVAVIRDTDHDSIYMKVNGKTDAGTGGDVTTQLWLGHQGLFLNPRARRVLVIGLGSGITAGSVLTHGKVEVDVVEISQAVVDGARFFSDANGGALDDPRMTLHVGDAKEFFALQPQNRYDVVVSEPSNPWISGVGNLFSRQYFTQISEHLNPGGLLVQWVHLYELNDELMRIIFNTIGSVFDHVEVWQCNESDVLVVAGATPIELDPGHIGRLLTNHRIARDLNRPVLNRTLRRPIDFLGSQVLSAERFRTFFPGEPPFNEDTHPILEYRAPRAFFANQSADLLWRLDERLLSPRASRLYLSQAIEEVPPPPFAIDDLVTVLGGRGSPSDIAILRSLAWSYLAARSTEPERVDLIRQVLDPDLVRVFRDPGAQTSFDAVLARAAQSTSVFYAPGPGDLPARASAGDALRVLGALTRGADPAALAPLRIPSDPGPVEDPAGWAESPLPPSVLHDLHLGHAWLATGPAACALPPLERAAEAAPTVFPIPQLVARARARAAQEPCP